MLKQVKKPNGKSWVADVIQDTGNTDYVKNGDIISNAPIKMVLVSSQSDLTLLTDYEPGTIAYTAGFQTMWQKAPDNTWANM